MCVSLKPPWTKSSSGKPTIPKHILRSTDPKLVSEVQHSVRGNLCGLWLPEWVGNLSQSGNPV